MNIEMLFSFFDLPSMQAWAEFFSRNQKTIDLLSVSICGLTALLMGLAYRRVLSEKWIKYFAVTFGLLGAQYLFSFVLSLISGPSDPRSTSTLGNVLPPLISQILSIATNLSIIMAVRDIQNRKPLFPRFSKPKTIGQKEERLIPWKYWVLAIASVITTITALVMKLRTGVPEYISEWIGRSGESIFSAITLFVVGYAIVTNLSLRRSPFRLLALLIAGLYALVQIGFGVSPWFAENYISGPAFNVRLGLADAPLVFFALIFKIFLSVATYLLVIRFFGTLNELRQLQDSGFKKTRQDYLSSEGVAEVIARRLLKIPGKPRNKDATLSEGEGFVNLVIRLPGENNKRVACIWWPNTEEEKKARILDWKLQEFFPLGDREDPNDRSKFLEWEKATGFLNLVLGDENHSQIVWPEDQLRLGHDIEYDGQMSAVASVAIKADGAAIGCLQVARYISTFSQMAIRQIRGIANLLTPSVQAYRELAGLDNMSIRFAERQADNDFYSSERATDEIATIIHDLFGSTLTRLSVDFGFSGPELVYRTKPGKEDIRLHFDRHLRDDEAASKVTEIKESDQKSNHDKSSSETLLDKRQQNEKQLSREKKWENYPADFEYDRNFYRILKKGLTARVTETLSYKPLDEPDRFQMGHMVLVVNSQKDDYNQPALGITYLHRKGASTLAADAYLDFQRDYHSQILKKLGQELSAKRIKVDEWFEPIQRLLTKDAALSWVVAGQNGAKDLLGDEKGKSIISRLDQLQLTMRPFSEPEIEAHYPLVKAEYNTHHVLKLRLSDSDTFIWLGVRRKGFGSELDFASPWKTFLINFVQIADASLSRITFPERFGLQLEAAQLQGIIASLATTGTVIHQFRNMIEGQLSSIQDLLEMIDHEGVPEKDSLTHSLIHMSKSAKSMREVFESISRFTRSEDQRPCSLVQAAHQAFRLFETSLVKRGIKREVAIPEDLLADVPFNVAALAFATLVGNSKDAIEDNTGTIRIEANRNGEDIICRVIDNGVGIHYNIRSKIFDPKNSAKPHGTGMGLFLTAHSLSENDSSISLTKSDETGSIFTLRFPLANKRS